MITGKTKLLGVIGSPIEHSLSPVMHNAAITQMGVDYVYLPFAIQPGDLSAALAGFAAIGVQGFSVTIPHKQAIIPLLAELSPVAQAVGAVNTVFKTDQGWGGTNTDIAGFLAPLRTETWNQKVAVILGNGGAARAVVAGCQQLGCAEIHVVGRSESTLAAFQHSWQNSPYPIKIQTHLWDQLSTLMPRAHLLVNTTPVGMYPHIDNSPVSETVMDKLQENTIVYDLIYTPNPTQFLQGAQSRGAKIIDGLEMLVQQGAAALQIWLQQPVPVDVMRQALQQHLKMH